MKFKIKFLIIITLITTISISIINLKNTSKTYLYFLNFKTEKLTIGNFITLSFLTGLTTSITFSYLISKKNKNHEFNSEKFQSNPEISQENFINSNTEIRESIDKRPPERDIRESQPTISVNYRVIKKNNLEINDIDEQYKDKRYQNNDDWEEIESNW